ncbi:MAG: hypothetical protein Q9M36_14025 [Sulfurovum sp.]|nr:hypothetical protein [Sulfurovum sp.]
MNDIGKVEGIHILLLQGPIGFFFKRLDTSLRKGGAHTYRIGLNMGDSIFSYSDNYTPYYAEPKAWESFIETFLQLHSIQKIFLFGDCRFYQRITIDIALKLEIEIYVFEEGYIRPEYITLEKYGVNEYSHLPRTAGFYDALDLETITEPKDAVPNPISNWAIVIAYYFFAKLFHFRYIHYVHHREYSARKELFLDYVALHEK